MAYLVRTSVDPKYCPRFKIPVTSGPGASLTGGKQVSGEGVFTYGVQSSPHKHIPDIFAIVGIWAVSEDFRKVVERLEPDLHQFFPIDLTRKNGEPLDKPYYLLNICQSANAFDPELSDMKWIETPISKKRVKVLKVGGKIVLRKELTAGWHLWRGQRTYSGQIYFSEGLMDAVLDARLPAIVGTPVEEV